MQRRFAGSCPDRHLQLPVGFPAATRAAQISALPEFAWAAPFPRPRWAELEGFAPEILLGYGFELDRLAAAVTKGQFRLATMRRAIYALTDCGTRILQDDLRDRLWRVFGVPVYELIIGPGPFLVASECEAYDGWHLQPGFSVVDSEAQLVLQTPMLATFRTGFAGRVNALPCACGQATARLTDLQPLRRQAKPADVSKPFVERTHDAPLQLESATVR